MNLDDNVSYVLKMVRYKKFRWHWDEERQLLYATFDAWDPSYPQGLYKPQTTRKWFISEHATRSEIIQTMLKCVLTAEEHEAREQFLVDGRAIYGPHISSDVLWAVCNATDKRPTPQEMP